MAENSNSNDDHGADQVAMTDDLFGWPGDGLHWAWQRCGRYEYQYHQLRMLCALRDKIAENDKSITGPPPQPA
jgi:hypothetical protein